jgi:uncharacterized protein YbjT (DUF2867 family)
MDGLAVRGFAGRMTTTPNTSRHPRVAVVGGTGRTGRRVADRLRARGLDVRVGSRNGSPPFHWERPDTWAAVLDGCSAAYIAYTPDFTHPGAADTLAAFAAQAHRSGLERLVLLSGRGDDDAERAEHAVRAAGVPTAVLRSSIFAQNFSEHFFQAAVVDGVIAVPASDVAEPFLDLEDLADVAERLLTTTYPSQETLELTGPRLLTFAEAAAELSTVLRRPVAYQPVTVDEFVAGALDAGVARAEAEALGVVFEQVFDGRNAYTTDTVERMLGRPAGDFAAYVRRAAASGAWIREESLEEVAS